MQINALIIMNICGDDRQDGLHFFKLISWACKFSTTSFRYGTRADIHPSLEAYTETWTIVKIKDGLHVMLG